MSNKKKNIDEKLNEQIKINEKNEIKLKEEYEQKLKNLEEEKEEKINELNTNIADTEFTHQNYADEVEEDIKSQNEIIEGLTQELGETGDQLNQIQSENEIELKNNYNKFKKEKEELENLLNELINENKKCLIG